MAGEPPEEGDTAEAGQEEPQDVGGVNPAAAAGGTLAAVVVLAGAFLVSKRGRTMISNFNKTPESNSPSPDIRLHVVKKSTGDWWNIPSTQEALVEQCSFTEDEALAYLSSMNKSSPTIPWDYEITTEDIYSVREEGVTDFGRRDD